MEHLTAMKQAVLLKSKKHKNSADCHSDINNVFEFIGIQFTKYDLPYKIANQTPYDSDCGIDKDIEIYNAVCGAHCRGIKICKTKIKLNRGKIRHFILGRTA